MKRYWCILLSLMLLSGCGAQQTFETVDDVYVQPAAAPLKQLHLPLPEAASVPAMQSDDGSSLYMCDGYTLTVHTLESGDLESTFLQLTGFTPEQLTVLETVSDGVRRYDGVWTAVGEGADQVGRITVLDDGNYHYAATVMADSAKAGELTDVWNQLLGAAELISTG